jgi:uncharacterized protein (TIGR02145 family)
MRSCLNFLVFVSLSILLFVTCIKPDETVDPVACFEMSKDLAETNESVTFTNCSQDADKYVWNFGDGETSTDKDPTHSYSEVGSFTINLLAEKDENYDQITKVIQIILAVDVATISTNSVTDITENTAKCGGNITSDGDATITARGVCWSTSENPTITNDHTSDGTGIGTFTSRITGLLLNTQYHVRAYATNSEGTSYGENKTFTTLEEIIKPTVTTTAISSITENSAVGGGDVTNNGGGAVIERGVCWSTSTNPSVYSTHTSDGDGTGSFTSNLTNLTENTTYYVKAYATNSEGTAYGNEISFTTEAEVTIPLLTTTAPGSITSSSATSGGNIATDGGSSVTTRGVCWSTSTSPTTSDSYTNDGSGTGVFSSVIAGLAESTTYYVRAYATNSVGTAYGNQKSFTTTLESTTVTDYDGNVYQIVEIGNQVWMAENLKTTHYANGTSLVDGTNAGDIYGDYTSKFYFAYNNDESNVSTYGKLYTWEAAMNGSASSSSNPSGVQGVCPNGWHMPSTAEWDELTDYLGGQNSGGKLKETGYTHWNEPNSGASNSSGFTALPGGMRFYDGTFYSLRENANFWTSDFVENYGGYGRSLSYDSEYVNPFYTPQNYIYGYSVRCVKD